MNSKTTKTTDLPQTNQLRGTTPTISIDKILKKYPHTKSFSGTGCKDACLKYLQANCQIKPKLYHFSQDINLKMAKNHLAIDRESVYTLSLQGNHLYEEYPKNKPIKLHLDIDLDESKYPNNIRPTEEEFNIIMRECLDSVTKKLHKEYQVDLPKIIILDATTEKKYSRHLIFENVIFPNCDAIKFFIMSIDCKWIKLQVLDTNVYKSTGSFRLLFNSKFGKTNTLKYYKGINYDYKSDKKLFMDCLITNIPKDHHFIDIEIPKSEKVNKKIIPIRQKNIIDKIGFVTCSNDLVHLPVSTLKKYLDIIDIERANSYGTWISMAMCLHNCNPDQECFDLFDEWSKNSDSYISKAVNVYFWNRFEFGHKSIGTLKYWAKLDNPEKYRTIDLCLEKEKFKAIEFDSDFLLGSKKENIKDQKSFVSKYVCEWQNSENTKTLAIKSAYGTGKTKLIKNILNEFDVKSVLFGSYRQTLTHELYGNFKDDGVKSYLDRNFESKKLICQIESLDRLLETDSFLNSDMEVPSYDLVILDEIEGILSHFRSSTLTEKERIFNLLKDIIHNSKKLLVLDGDFHNRSYDFIKYFGESIILKNIRKKNQKNFIFTSNRRYFEEEFEKSINNNENINLVSMSSTLATFYYDKYKDTCKSVLHCAKSHDNYKESLKNVEKFWIDYKLVIFSPHIEAGTSFAIEHFDKLYIILSPDSTSQRGLMQMCSRIRNFKGTDVLVYLNKLPFSEVSNFFTYDEIFLYIKDMYNKYLPYTVYTNEKNKRCVGYEFNLYSQILVHNEKENANKSNKIFIPYLLHLLKEKGHSYKYLDDIKYSKASIPLEKVTVIKDEILNALDIDDTEYNRLLKNQRENCASREDKVQIERYLFMKHWKIDTLTAEFLDKYYGLSHSLSNLRDLIDKDISVYDNDYDFNGNVTIKYDAVNKLERIEMISEVLKELTFEIGKNIVLSKEDFEKKIQLVTSKTKLFININKSQPLFHYDKLKIKQLTTIKRFMGFMNSLLRDWGLVIINNIKTTSKIIDSKKITINNSLYEMHYIYDMNKYI